VKVSFHGAAGEVTGSQHLFENKGSKILVDCGLFQGRREETYRKNRHASYDDIGLNAVVLSHAHLDHSGRLPRLAGLGYDGPVYCSPITEELCDPMLKDSAHIQQKDLEFVNKLHRRKGLPPFNLLYGPEETEKILSQFEPRPLHEPFDVVPGTRCTFIEAGHVLGSAQVVLDFEEKGRKLRVGYTGDLGRMHLPILNDPEQMSDLDVMIMESTYGNRDHDPVSESGTELKEVIQSTFAQGGKLIIPAFALERTQELLFLLAQLHASGELPSAMPVYVDSPLAIKCTEIFHQHAEAYDPETQALIRGGTNPFEFPGLHFVKSVEESMSLNDPGRSMIIIAASGMMEAGRILHHLRNNIENSRNTILIVSFQAEHTLGRRIAERVRDVNIFGEPHQLRARVKILNTFSGHAGRSDLLAYAKAVADRSPRLKKVFIVHGEESQSQALLETLRSWRRFECIYPQRGAGFEL
jgi:metallo-beta-lactamase family protein